MILYRNWKMKAQLRHIYYCCERSSGDKRPSPLSLKSIALLKVESRYLRERLKLLFEVNTSCMYLHRS